MNKDEKKERRKKKPKATVSSEPTPPPSQFGSTAINSVPAIVPKPTKDVFGRGDLRDKVKRDERAPSEDKHDYGDDDDASSIYDPLSMFQKRDELNPPTKSSSSPPESTSRHHKDDRDEKRKKRERKKRRSGPSSPPPPPPSRRRSRTRSRSPVRRSTRSDRRRDELKRKLDGDNFTITRSNTKDEVDLLGVALDSKERVFFVH